MPLPREVLEEAAADVVEAGHGGGVHSRSAPPYASMAHRPPGPSPVARGRRDGLAPPRMDADAFITRWTGGDGGAERANYALFLSELCDVIGVERPQPASVAAEKNDYVFERFVRRPDGSNGRIDLYKRDSFVLEAKQSRQSDRTLTGEANDKYLPDAPRQLGLELGETPGEGRGRRGARRG